MGELFSRILERIAERTKDTGSIIVLPNAEIPLDESCYKPIMPQEAKRIAFVDGGNAEILKAPNFSLQFIRLYATIHEGNKRVKQAKKEFYALIFAQNKNGLGYEIETFDTDLSFKEQFAANDATLRTGMHLATPNAVADVVRTFAEYTLAQEICAELRSGDVLVRDGDLQPTATHAKKYLDDLVRIATQKGIVLCGLSKTTSILTDTGNSAPAVLQKMAPAGTWLYQPPGTNICFVKLHPKSGFVFRLDVIKTDHARTAAFALASQAVDPVFLGYPYGLVEADQYAQVPGNEAAKLRFQVRAHGGTQLKAHLAALSAHDTLNKI